MAHPPRRYAPVPGITVDIIEKRVQISGQAQVWGEQATPLSALLIQNTVNRVWNQNLGDRAFFKCDFTVTHRAAATRPSNMLQIELAPIEQPSAVVRPRFGQTYMRLDSRLGNVLEWVVAHEFGHIIGLKDRYTESLLSQVGSNFGFKRETTPLPGYESNIMATDEGTLALQNLTDIADDIAGRTPWLQTDDQVRAYVKARTPEMLQLMTVDTRLAALATLMEGWISDEDVAAMVALIAAVRSPANAARLRSGVDLTVFNSVAQRNRVADALAKMPR